MEAEIVGRRSWLSVVRRRPWRSLALAALIGFVGLNLLAYQHAAAMLTYRDDAVRPPSPESLSWSQTARALVCGVAVPRPQNKFGPGNLNLKSETILFRAADGAGLEAWVLRAPEARGTVLLFHGYSAARDSMLEEADEFLKLGYDALLVDFRGCGGSDGATTTLGYREADDVAAAVEQAKQHGLPQPWILFGRSMGAAAVLRSIAVYDVRPAAVILEAPFADMLGAIRNRFHVMQVPSFPAAELLLFWGGVQTGLAGFEHNPVEYAAHCKVPMLVLHGESDRLATLSEGRAVCDAAAGSKEFVSFAGAGHTSLHTVDPQRWRSVVTAFLQAHTAPPAKVEAARLSDSAFVLIGRVTPSSARSSRPSASAPILESRLCDAAADLEANSRRAAGP